MKPPRELEVTMLTGDPFDAFGRACEHGRRLRAAAAAEHLRGPAGTRHLLAAFLRRAADRLDPAPLDPKPALR